MIVTNTAELSSNINHSLQCHVTEYQCSYNNLLVAFVDRFSETVFNVTAVFVRVIALFIVL